MRVLGVSAFYHDSAAALVVDGKICAAAQEERFTRVKHDEGFPVHAIKHCLHAAGISLREVDYVVFYEKPFIKFERLLETYLYTVPWGFKSFAQAMPIWLGYKLFQKKHLLRLLGELAGEEVAPDKLLFSEHHISHAASAFYPSPFSQAAILTLDGVGEWATTSGGVGDGKTIDLQREIHFPHSLGLLYSAVTYYTGFKVNSGEYKVMGLAPYGKPIYAQKFFDNIIDLKEDGSFFLNQKYFDYATGLRMTNRHFDELFGRPARCADELLEPFHMDMAASVQAVTEEVMFRLVNDLVARSGMTNVCMAGGVALNCVANGHLLRKSKAQNLWVQPAAGDAGGALGAALAVYYRYASDGERAVQSEDSMQGALLGVAFGQEEVEQRLSEAQAAYTVLSYEDMINRTAQDLSDGKVIGWMQGRMEFGPRALGARSIIADPRSSSMQKTLNLKIKYRESFRPFAPAVLREDVGQWFNLAVDSPYMLLVSDVLESRRLPPSEGAEELFGIDKLNVARSTIPAVTHVDYSARIQTVSEKTNPIFHALISRFKAITGCPVVVNTSFNVRGEPIVCTPEDAFRCFMGTDMDILVVGNCYLEKDKQLPDLKRDYKEKFAPD